MNSNSIKITGAAIVCLLLATAASFAQSSAVVSAWNYMNHGELANAKASIDQAALDAKTSIQAKTWYYRGTIYLAIFDDTTMNQATAPVLNEAITSLKKVLELDPKYPEKGTVLNELLECAFNARNFGVEPYNTKKYDEAYTAFKTSSDLYSYVMSADPQRKADTAVVSVALETSLYAANAATKAKMFAEAKPLYENLLAMKYEKADIYVNLGDVYLSTGDTAKSIAIVAEGVSKYPDDQGLMIQQLNLLLAKGDMKEVIKKLNEAIAKAPSNPTLYTVLGDKYEQMGDTMNARITYAAAIKSNPTSFDAYYRMGALFYNTAVIINNTMNKLPDDAQAQYDKLKIQRDQLFNKSLPYLEKAAEINPKDLETLTALKEVYARLNNVEKMNEEGVKIEDLKKQ